MKVYLLFLFLLFICRDTICFASDEFVLLQDFSSKVLVGEAAKKCPEVSESEDAISSSALADSLTSSSVSGSKVLISLKCMGINDITFEELSSSLLAKESIFSGRQLVLDISENGITPNSALSLKSWLDKPEIAYLNICGNVRCAMKNVRNLCSAFMMVVDGIDEASKKTAVKNYMARIVFLPKYYVWHAQNRVKTYSALSDEGYLHVDWAEKLKNYYKAVDKVKDDCIFKEGELREGE